MYSGEITPGVFQHVRRFLLQRCPEIVCFSDVLPEKSLQGVPACPEVFAPEMYTSLEIFASEMYSREITPGVFQHVRRFLLWRYMSRVFAPEILQRCPEIVCFADVLQRNHSRGVPACLEVFAAEMYTSPEIFASEMYSGEITPGVFQHFRRFLLGDTCPEFLLQRNHSGSVPTCLESFSSEMYSIEITPGVFSMSRDVSSGDPHMSEDFCIGDEITPGVFLHIWRFLLQRYMSRDFFSGDILQRITLGVFSMSGEFCSGDVHMSEDFCFRDVFRRNHSRSAPAHLKVVGPEMHVQRFLLRRCTPEKSLQECSSMSRDFCSGDCLFQRCTLERSLQGCSSIMFGGFCSRDVHMSEDFCLRDVLQRNHSRSVCSSMSGDFYSGVWSLDMYF
jgi:hypothetical protein